jgi:hypothetical protein
MPFILLTFGIMFEYNQADAIRDRKSNNLTLDNNF